MLPSLAEIDAAETIIGRHMAPTPQYCWPLLAGRCGCTVWVKHENHTPIGAFNPDFSPKNSVESDYLLQTNSYRNFREATKIQGVFPFRAVFRPAAGGFARFRRAIARRPASPSSFPCFATHR